MSVHRRRTVAILGGGIDRYRNSGKLLYPESPEQCGMRCRTAGDYLDAVRFAPYGVGNPVGGEIGQSVRAEPCAGAAAYGIRLFVYLFFHIAVVSVGTDSAYTCRKGLRLSTLGIATSVDVIDAAVFNAADLSLRRSKHAACIVEYGRSIRGYEALTVADGEYERTVMSYGVYHIRYVVKQYRKRIGAAHLLACLIYRRLRLAEPAILAVDEMCDTLGICLAGKCIALVEQLPFDLCEVVENAVVDECKGV